MEATLPRPSSNLSLRIFLLPKFDISYFFDRNIGVEIIAGVIPERITDTGTLADPNVGQISILAC